MLNKGVRIALEIFLAGVLAGCQQTQPYMTARGPQVKPGLVMIPVDQARHYARHQAPPWTPPAAGDWAGTEVGSVQTPPQVSAIQFNRYADPARPAELMHEAHIVYRREAGPRWRLRPASAEQQILIGPSVTDGRGEIQPVQSQELEAFVREQRTNVQRQQELVVTLADGMQRLAAQQEQLARELAAVKATAGGPEAALSPADSGEDPPDEAPLSIDHP